jgi:predicted thioesterase
MSQIRKRTIADFLVTGGGTVYLLHPLTDAAREWVAEHLPEDAQRLGNAIAVEHRYIRDIVYGARHDGLAVR